MMNKIYIIFTLLLIKPFECYGSLYFGKTNGFDKHYKTLKQGVYTYVDKKTKEAQYVGMTNDFDRRDKEHKAANDYYASSNYILQKTNMPGASREEMYREEKRQIKDKHPVANKYSGGNGPR